MTLFFCAVCLTVVSLKSLDCDHALEITGRTKLSIKWSRASCKLMNVDGIKLFLNISNFFILIFFATYLFWPLAHPILKFGMLLTWMQLYFNNFTPTSASRSCTVFPVSVLNENTIVDNNFSQNLPQNVQMGRWRNQPVTMKVDPKSKKQQPHQPTVLRQRCTHFPIRRSSLRRRRCWLPIAYDV